MAAVNYLFSKKLQTFAELATTRMSMGLGAVLLLQGEPGGGKTEFALAVARRLKNPDGTHATFHKYQCAPDRERNLLYDYDMDGIVRREGAWIAGPAWEAFEASQTGFSVLLIDEVDKTHPNFDAFLLELLEQMQFRAPMKNVENQPFNVYGNPNNLMIILTSNGRRELRQEVLRRCQRIAVPYPERPRLDNIIQGIATGAEAPLPQGLLNLLIRVGAQLRKDNAENAPSPKEMALCGIDMLVLGYHKIIDPEIWRDVAVSYMVKDGTAMVIDKAMKFRWAKAFMTEVYKPSNNDTSTYERKYPIAKRKKTPKVPKK